MLIVPLLLVINLKGTYMTLHKGGTLIKCIEIQCQLDFVVGCVEQALSCTTPIQLTLIGKTLM